jgi:putative GTP pyrophosphokinase
MSIDKLLEIFDTQEETLELLKNQIQGRFLVSDILPKIHSMKIRKKRRTHLKEKLTRKISEGKVITPENFLNEITDLVGIRILLLYPQYFKDIHDFILKLDADQDWILHEPPTAYTWDPEMEDLFKKGLNIEKVEKKESLYTSLHYVVKPNTNSPCCEIQVRTLMEEVWGEIDHEFNYPSKNENKHLQDNLKALAKLIASGTKLTEIIYNLGQESS